MHTNNSFITGLFAWLPKRLFISAIVVTFWLNADVASAVESPYVSVNHAAINATAKMVSHASGTLTPANKSQALKSAKKSGKKSARKSNVQVGSASWYGKAFQGKPTASGESYDMFQYTAAHRNLPLGTWVRVTNLHNGKSLIVKVNDRGPFVDTGHRIMDLSYAAARMLNFSGQGLARVKLEVVEPETIAYASLGSDVE